jgi:hypothetical protein
MTRFLRSAIVIVAGWALIGCAGGPPPTPAPTWTGGDPARLAADQADCRGEADAVDVHQAAGYSDPRYGVTSAMAAAVSDYSPLVDQRAAIRAAAFDTCMNDKGWKAR